MGRSGNGPAVGLAAQLALLVALLALLDTTVGLGGWGWAVALTFGVGINAAVARGLVRNGGRGPAPGDLVTLTRATLACGVAALVADSWREQQAPAALVSLAAAALLLDAVDGWVARRTRTSSAFGALIDGEVDAFLIAVLSVYVGHSVGWWVLPIGAARYVFAVAGWVAPLPWLRGYLLPPRYWRKVVTATAGIVLTVAAADVLPRPLTYALLVVALGLIAESFGRDTWWLWRRRPARAFETAEPAAEAGAAGVVAGPPGDEPAHTAGPPGRARHRRRRLQHPAVSGVTTVLALLLVWFALVAPNQAYLVTPRAFLRIPVEGLAVAGLALVLPSWARRTMAAVVGVLLGILTLLKLLDMGFFAAFDRPFDLATDRGYLGPAVGLARDTFGSVGGTVAVVAVAALVLAVLVCLPLSVGRLTALVARHRSWSARTVSGLVVVCIGCAMSGLQVGPDEPVASTSAGRLAAGHVRSIAADAHDQERFDAAARVDRFRQAPRRGLLSGLRGRDVTVVFVESYGRIAVKGSPTAPEVRALLDDETRRLRASGYSSASAYLTSPTFGGLSWLAHGTLQSGLWVDNQRRYERLLSGDRLTLTRAFRRAGWRTVGILPSGGDKWPEGKRFYRFDRVYGRWDLGYQGPRFGFSKMPDQFALLAFQRLELGKRHRRPVMAEIELASSHEPWAKTPHMIPWTKVGDGSVFEPMADEVEIPVPELWDDPDDVKAAYGQSILYSLRTLFSFVRRYGDKNSVLVVVGDHQPSTAITGPGASRDVPVTIIAHDPKVLDQISGWGWQDGLRPGSRAPVWRMDDFRDRFLSAYSP